MMRWGLTIESGGEKAYFSSKRDEKSGKDIYSFRLYEAVQPDPVAYIKGKVSDKITGQLLVAEYELINLSTGKLVFNNKTDAGGNFLVCLPAGNNYGLNISKNGYLFYSENFMLEGAHSVSDPFIKNIKLSPFRVGERMLLANVFYEVDSWQLKKESLTELNMLSDLLKNNKELIIEIGGYTDSTGSDDYNLNLSEKRALSVVDYLVKSGIERSGLLIRDTGILPPWVTMSHRKDESLTGVLKSR
ncbi:MAG: OmpA family protein [Bacteroidales bacterium]